MTGLIASSGDPSSRDAPRKNLVMLWAEELSILLLMGRRLGKNETKYPILARILRGAYGPESLFPVRGEDQATLLREIDELLARVGGGDAGAEERRLSRAVGSFGKRYPHMATEGASMDAARAGLRSLKDFVQEARKLGWTVWNNPD